ncbi:hypothetical protein J4230_05250 [Candidatus Woesearchaeota archaeon]|nr:hypothetical protein [Candidatus Woesearchaeota archaeon]
MKLKSSRLFCFCHGNYGLLNDSLKENCNVKVIVEFTKTWNYDANGYSSFVQNGEEILRINPVRNAVTIIKVNKNTKSFVKYINHLAGKNKRYFVELDYIEK